jgi:Inorganic pyrophosphatase
VLVGEPTFPGCRIRGRVVGVFNMTDEKGSDEKIILVPLRDPAWMRVHDIHDIQPEFRDEIEHFFQVYKDLEDAKTETRGSGNRAEAERVIEEARRRKDETENVRPRQRATRPAKERGLISALCYASSLAAGSLPRDWGETNPGSSI